MNTKYDDEGLPVIHVSNYNVENQESWVAMSGDKRISGVLAFGLGSVILEDLFTLPGVEEWSETILTVIDSRGSNGGHAWVSDAYRVQTFSSLFFNNIHAYELGLEWEF